MLASLILTVFKDDNGRAGKGHALVSSNAPSPAMLLETSREKLELKISTLSQLQNNLIKADLFTTIDEEIRA